MSYSIFIPVKYAFDYASNTFNDCISIDINPSIENGVVQLDYDCSITLLVPHPCGQPGVQTEITLQLYPSFKTGEPTKIEGFMFSGFYSSCQSVIRTLDMPADTEIY